MEHEGEGEFFGGMRKSACPYLELPSAPIQATTDH